MPQWDHFQHIASFSKIPASSIRLQTQPIVIVFAYCGFARNHRDFMLSLIKPALELSPSLNSSCEVTASSCDALQ